MPEIKIERGRRVGEEADDYKPPTVYAVHLPDKTVIVLEDREDSTNAEWAVWLLIYDLDKEAVGGRESARIDNRYCFYSTAEAYASETQIRDIRTAYSKIVPR